MVTSDVLPDDAELAATLDDLIERLSRGKRSTDARNALLEAKRLKSATLKWGAIPPPPDSRRELLERVTRLLVFAPEREKDDERPPESKRGAGKKGRSLQDEKTVPGRRFVGIHDEKTKPEGRMPSIHDEETAPLPSKASALSANERRRGKGRSVYDEDTAPGPDLASTSRPTEAPPPSPEVVAEVRVEPAAPPKKREIVDEPTAREGSVRPPATLASPRPRTASSTSSPKVEPAKAEPAKVEPPKVEPVKLEPAKVEPAKAPPPKVQRTLSTPMIAPLQDLDLSDLELFAPAAPPKAELGGSPQLPPIVMPALTPAATSSAGAKPKIEGFSSSVSSASMPALRPPVSKPTEPMPAVKEGSGVTIVRAAEVTTQRHPSAAGVTVRKLREQGGITISLVRLPAGTRLPAKPVVEPSELIVLAGAVTIGPHELTVGDVCRIDKGSTRQAVSVTAAAAILVTGAAADV